VLALQFDPVLLQIVAIIVFYGGFLVLVMMLYEAIDDLLDALEKRKKKQ